MKKIKIESIVAPYLEQSNGKYPKWLVKLMSLIIARIIYPKKVRALYNRIADKKGISFIEELFEHLNFTYKYSEKDYRKIPYEGKLFVVVNHPLGGLDALSVFDLIYSLRTDVKLIVADILMNIENINEFFIPLNSLTWKPDAETLNEVDKIMKNEGVIIMFPSLEVSRSKYFRIKDKTWSPEIIKAIRQYNANVLPVFINSKNSFFFYLLSSIKQTISMLFLPREILKKRSKSINITIGNPLPPSSFKSEAISDSSYAKLLQKHVYRIGRGKKGVFREEMTIIHPIDVKLLKKELANSEKLASLPGGELYIVLNESAPNVVKEISRLREITFRKVGEGTGKNKDQDFYDQHYHHLILWNPLEAEIIGAYRLGIVRDILEKHGFDGLYSSELYFFDEEFMPEMNAALELGRSFIQQKYWRTMSLDLLWQGIGIFLSKNPHIRYLFGSVSISNNYNDFAKSAIVSYYKNWFGSNKSYVHGKNKFEISTKDSAEIQSIFKGVDYTEDFRLLKNELKNFGLTVPVLFRQYTELCEFGGAKFLEFNIDTGFSNCVDGFIVLDSNYFKESKLSRYRTKI